MTTQFTTDIEHKLKIAYLKRDFAIQKVWWSFLTDDIFYGLWFSCLGNEYNEICYIDSHGYQRTVVTIQQKSSWDKTEINDIVLSHSSGGCNSNNDYLKMIALGEIAKVVRDFKDDIIAHLNTTLEPIQNEIKDLERARQDLLQAERLRKEKDKERVLAQTLQKASHGLNFGGKTFPEEIRYTNNGLGLRNQDPVVLKVNRNDEISRIAKFKINKISPTGKTAKVEVTLWKDELLEFEGFESQSYHSEPQTLVHRVPVSMGTTLTFDRVKMIYIREFIEKYLDRITDNLNENGDPIWDVPTVDEVKAFKAEVKQ